MDKLIMAIASGCYTGYLPIAPGTWGTLVAFPLHLLLIRLSQGGYYTSLGLIFGVAVLTAGSAEKILDRGDPGVVVIDEIVGVLIALAAVPLHPAAALAGFALFRLFDIAKPFPVGWVDRHLHGGLGIMLDDVAAGLYALLVLHLGLWLLA